MPIGKPYVTTPTAVLYARIAEHYSEAPRKSAVAMYLLLRNLHVSLAILSISGFLLRAYWMSRDSAMLDQRVVRILPHIIDSAFLVTGIGLILLLQLQLMQSPWLLAKLAALLAYIVFGTIALKRGRTLRIRLIALLFAVLTFAYIVGVAFSKSPASWLRSGTVTLIAVRYSDIVGALGN